MRRSLLRCLLIGLLVALGLSGAAFASTYTALELDTMIMRSDVAFYGVVSELSVTEEAGEVWTVVRFEVLETLRGEAEEARELRFFGAAERAVTVVGMPQFVVGETVLILAYDAPYYSPIVGFNQALWRLGVRGFEDGQGRLLSLEEDGTLALDGEGGEDTAVLLALREALGGNR